MCVCVCNTHFDVQRINHSFMRSPSHGTTLDFLFFLKCRYKISFLPLPVMRSTVTALRLPPGFLKELIKSIVCFTSLDFEGGRGEIWQMVSPSLPTFHC
ncbi:hypothetical protein CEXT_134021 [Caerostris extrusa]|uniref:Uncharacterized protein n=1 Tax=Caerostris extrusa TaxID=172846 RepID=A0AAV4MZQ9_CAEEX|nr:hypothetical protein CEXT_134021 [Caerostris extrusa]